MLGHTKSTRQSWLADYGQPSGLGDGMGAS